MGSRLNSYPTVALRNFNVPENARVKIRCRFYQVREPEMTVQDQKPHCHKIILPGRSTEEQSYYDIEVFKESYTAV